MLKARGSHKDSDVSFYAFVDATLIHIIGADIFLFGPAIIERYAQHALYLDRDRRAVPNSVSCTRS